jgi:hypothetical protein
MHSKHVYALMGMVNKHPRGTREAHIKKTTGMSDAQLAAAYLQLNDRIQRYQHPCGAWGFYRLDKPTVNGNLPTRREAIPMSQLPMYTGETRRAGSV